VPRHSLLLLLLPLCRWYLLLLAGRVQPAGSILH
jgi:hypothetical protein